jgi:predicted dehydrogenase
VSLRFANGSEGMISYLANGDRSYSKERIEVFGGGRTAVLEDFRRLELAQGGRKQTVASRWRQDKGHRAEWNAFVESVTSAKEPPIPLEEIVCSALATFAIERSLATGERVEVNSAAFLDEIQRSPNLNPNLGE